MSKNRGDEWAKLASQQAQRRKKPSLIILLGGSILLAIFLSTFFKPSTSDYSPVDKKEYKLHPSKPLSPEELAARDKAQKEAEDVAGQQQAVKLLNTTKAYEAFLVAAEQEFRKEKPQNADLDTIRRTLTLIDSLADSLNNARRDRHLYQPDDLSYFKKLEKRLAAFQTLVLPGLRKAFQTRSADLLWEQDIYVRVFGQGNTSIEFSGALFSLNATIKRVQELVEDVVVRLRFKQTRYKWDKDADKVTRYDLATPPDAKLVLFRDGEFQEMAPDR